MFGYRILALGGSHPNRNNRVTITLTISSDVNNYDIQANRGGTYSAGNTDVIVINNAHIKSTASNTHALQTGTTWTSGDTITIDNNSSITADGGNGGAGGAGSVSGQAGGAGGAGGFAISINYPVSIDNTGGTISGGGGGGGGGGSTQNTRSAPKGASFLDTAAGGGGGGGAGTGQGGAAGATGSGNGNNLGGSVGDAGTIGAAGANGTGGSGAGYNGGEGGPGGALGSNGTAGVAAHGGNADGPGGAAGAAGKAVNLNGNAVTWIANGTRNGAIS